jgi:uncharacterized membrane protein (UPF0127 family)
MRFALDVSFIDSTGRTIAVRAAVPANRIVREAKADAVLELPAGRTSR